MSNIYRIEIAAIKPEDDVEGRNVLHELQDFGLTGLTKIRAVKVYTLGGELSLNQAEKLCRELLVDPVVEMFCVGRHVIPWTFANDTAVEIRRRPGVMDPSEFSLLKGARELGLKLDWVRAAAKYVVSGAFEPEALRAGALRRLANEVIESVTVGREFELEAPQEHGYQFELRRVKLAGLNDAELQELSLRGQLYMSLPEMKTVQAHFAKLDRDPTDIELESLAQTWSEHCVHKTFRGRIRYREAGGEEELIDNLLKSTVAKATHELAKPWCLSVFVDNAGVIEFDEEYGAVFKVETHNHPSAIEPYGGAGTGIGGVIRDPLGTGLGAKPVLNTDVFCFGPPDLPAEATPKGALHPLRVMKGVVAGVRDYGNRMGIPTANGSLHFDPRFVGNPLVFAGNVAIIPRELAAKRRPRPGQIALVVGGRTGRDGIHGATFSSVELHEESETVSSGAVQIGNPIEEKKVLDFLLRARDAGLYTCITDCGAGGLSSALGELGAECGVTVELDRVPLKYAGLSYTEIWISEAQERMVIAADPERLPALRALAAEENVELTDIAQFTNNRQLILNYAGQEVGRLEMDFLHDGVPQIERRAEWTPGSRGEPELPADEKYGETLKRLLGGWDVCSKEAIIRQYDHEVQGKSVVKPLVGADHDGPGDAAVIAPRLGRKRALVVANGGNPRYSDIDPYHMAASAIDEALRNVVAVGGSLERCAILDNFCWGNCDKPDRLGGLVRAARACYDYAVAYGVPFISGKDSLNNEFATENGTIAIPGTLLISALAVLPDCRKALTMDAKQPGNLIYMVGLTRAELGGSQYYLLRDKVGDSVPTVDAKLGRQVLDAVSQAADAGQLRAAHDCSEGGLAVALAEMAFAGRLGLDVELAGLPGADQLAPAARLFSESNSRLLVEVEPGQAQAWEQTLARTGAPAARLGTVTAAPRLVVRLNGQALIDEPIAELKTAWQRPLGV